MNHFNPDRYDQRDLAEVLAMHAKSEAAAQENKLRLRPFKGMWAGFVAVAYTLEARNMAREAIPQIPYAAAADYYRKSYDAAWEHQNALFQQQTTPPAAMGAEVEV